MEAFSHEKMRRFSLAEVRSTMPCIDDTTVREQISGKKWHTTRTLRHPIMNSSQLVTCGRRSQ